MTATLGDLTQIPVTKVPTQGLPKLGDVSVTLYNQDLTNVVYISYQQWFAPGAGNCVPIQPLTSITISAKRAIYVAALVGGVLPLMVLPEGSQAQPSPAQIAAQINALGLAKDTSVNNPAFGPSTLAQQVTQQTVIPNNIATTGVPALNLKSTTQLASAQTITAGSTANLTAVTGINQPAYNLHITATSGASSTKPWYTVTIKWVDTASGNVVQVDVYTAFMSSTSGALSTIIAGPTDADQIQVAVTNNDTVTMTVNLAFFVLSSRTNYTTDIIYQFWTSGTQPPVATFQLGASISVPTSKVLFSVSRTLGIGLTTTPDYALPTYSGAVTVHFDGTASNNWDVIFTDQFTGAIMHRQTYTGPPAVGNITVQWPRTPITLRFINNGSVLGTLNCEVTAQ